MFSLNGPLSSHPIDHSFSFLLVRAACRGGRFWAKKPYQNWSADETRQMLEESPWATTLTLGSIQSAITSGDSPKNGATGARWRRTRPFPTICNFARRNLFERPWCATSQLNAKYDKMGAEQEAAFDASSAKFLAATFPDRVVVAVTFHANVQEYESLLRAYWTRQDLGTLSMTVFLNAGKERLSLVNYGFKDDTFQFTFPRPKQLNPNEKVGVEFVHPTINVIRQQRVLQEFSLKKMLVNGEPVL